MTMLTARTRSSGTLVLFLLLGSAGCDAPTREVARAEPTPAPASPPDDGGPTPTDGDPNACRSDADCPDHSVCGADGGCWADGTCESDEDCWEQEICDASQLCVFDPALACVSHDECGEGRFCGEVTDCTCGDATCQEDVCTTHRECADLPGAVPCEADTDCFSSEVCTDGACVIDPELACESDADCEAGFACAHSFLVLGCNENGDDCAQCVDRRVCSEDAGSMTFETCTSASDCPAAEQQCHGWEESVPLWLKMCLTVAGVDTSAGVCW